MEVVKEDAIIFVDKHNRWNLISWQSKRIKRIVRSTLAAETISIMDISVLLKELRHQLNKIPIGLYAHNKSLHDALRSQKYVFDKRIIIDIATIKKRCIRINKKRFHHIHWVKKVYQLADSLTKTRGDILP